MIGKKTTFATQKTSTYGIIPPMPSEHTWRDWYETRKLDSKAYIMLYDMLFLYGGCCS